MTHRSVYVFLLFLLAVSAAVGAQDEFDAAAVFNSRCGACHTVGRGDDVGPDLKGVTERREKTWLISFVQSSQSVIGAGDPTAVELFERYGRQKMPDHPYTPEQISEILAYIEQGGPVSTRIRLAASASPEDVRAGRELFFGGPDHETACASCHTVSAAKGWPRPYLGGSLTHGFSKYRDVELARVLARRRRLCDQVLEDEESFLVRAYLRQVDQAGGEDFRAAAYFPLLGFGLAALLLGVPGIARRRPRGGSP